MSAAGERDELDALSAELDGLYQRGVEAWPQITLSRESFSKELAARLRTADGASKLHHDVYLAIAANAGNTFAVDACQTIARREIEFAAARLGATPTQADDIRSELGRLLFTADAARASALASFTGRGDLPGYLRVIAAHALARRMQRDQREQSLDSGLFELLGPVLDPEVALLRERYRPDVEAAFARALTMLSDRRRAILRYHVVEGWSIDKLGEQYGVHRSTAARWLAEARAELGDTIRAELIERLVMTESQVDSIVALVTSRIEVSLDRLLS